MSVVYGGTTWTCDVCGASSQGLRFPEGWRKLSVRNPGLAWAQTEGIADVCASCLSAGLAVAAKKREVAQ